ncbi:MAG: FtsW/RodA/SpoVE family cell cycle protein [Pseudonocardia sp.]
MRGGFWDLTAVLAALAVVGVGVANLVAVAPPELAVRQAGVGLAGLVLVAALWRFRVRMLTVLGWACYLTAVVFLVAVEIVGVSANGATRWIGLGPLTFQPSELAKLGMLLVMAGVLGGGGPGTRHDGRRVALAVALALVPIALVTAQPDLSTGVLLVAVAVAMLVLGRVPPRLLLPMFAAGAVAAPLAIGLLRPHQVQRLGSFLVGSDQDPAGAGWTIQQARLTLGSGELVGPGQVRHDLLALYLPERDTDLAPASVVGQFGLVTLALVLVAMLVVVWRLALAARVPRTTHGSLVAGGLAVLFGVEVVVSTGGNLGLLPLAGVPFPLLSYGGTALLVHLAALGVALGLRRDGSRRRLWVPVGSARRRPRLVRVAAVAVTVALLAFGHYGWRLRADEGPALTVAAQEQITRCVRLPAPRGLITDRHGEPLATNADPATGQVTVLATPALLRAAPADLAALAAATNQPADALRAALDAQLPSTLAAPVAVLPAAAGAELDSRRLTGVMVVPLPRRAYPTGPLLGPLLGYTGVATPTETSRWPDLPVGEIVGRAGLEKQYDAVLRGINGQQCLYVDPHGVPVAPAQRVDPVPGANLRLAIDLGLQRVFADGLVAALRGLPRSVGAAVAMDPRNGQVLAMASVPAYDNTIYGPPVDAAALAAMGRAPGSPGIEHVSAVAVPPGSVFKLVMAAANQVHGALPAGRVVPTGGAYTYGNHVFHNWKAMGPMNLMDAIAWSNNVYFYKLAVALGPDKVIETARALGVGSRTGIDLPVESAGYLGTPSTVGERGLTWYGGSTVTLGIGQGYLTVTPLQVARWTAGVGTGHLVTPRLGLSTGTDSRTETALPPPALTPLPFADRLGPVREGMRATVTTGTARRLAGARVPAGAKTGTAQDGSLPDSSYDNWMTTTAPFQNPTIVMTAMVQGPGGAVNNAGAVVQRALEHYLARQAEIESTAPVRNP